MNGLLGYPASGPMGMSGLPDGNDQTANMTMQSVVDGSMRKTLKGLQREDMRLNAEIRVRKHDIDKMPDGPAKNKAFQAWQKASAARKTAYEDNRKAIDSYNELARKIRTYTLGASKPRLMSGLGLPPLVIAALVVAFGYLATALSGLVDSVMGNQASSKGYLQQAADLVKEGGGALTGVLGGINKLAWTGAIIAVGYVAYRELKARGKIGRKSSSTALALKPVEGTVIG